MTHNRTLKLLFVVVLILISAVSDQPTAAAFKLGIGTELGVGFPLSNFPSDLKTRDDIVPTTTYTTNGDPGTHFTPSIFGLFGGFEFGLRFHTLSSRLASSDNNLDGTQFDGGVKTVDLAFRFYPLDLPIASVWVSAGAGYARVDFDNLTGDQPGLHLFPSAGAEFSLFPMVKVGPLLRFNYVLAATPNNLNPANLNNLGINDVSSKLTWFDIQASLRVGF